MWPIEDQWRAPIGDFPPPWASDWGDDLYGLWANFTVNGVIQCMRWIEPSGPEGFWMGAPQVERDAILEGWDRDNANEHDPLHVVIAQGFWLADTPCTRAFWQAVTGKNSGHFRKGPGTSERPVENVSWDAVMDQFIACFPAAQEWCTDYRLSLPTEVEWEYAARAGTRTAYWWGDVPGTGRGNMELTKNRDWDGSQSSTPVRHYPPNPWGLYDVHGNVQEWCADVWHPRRDTPEAWPDADIRVVRGGSWFQHPGLARSASRSRRHCRGADPGLGFRFALRSPSGPGR